MIKSLNTILGTYRYTWNYPGCPIRTGAEYRLGAIVNSGVWLKVAGIGHMPTKRFIEDRTREKWRA